MLGEKRLVRIEKVATNEYIAKAEGERSDIVISKKDFEARQGDTVEVFIYDYKNDEYYATIKPPLIQLGQVKKLEVKSVVDAGIFIDWGLENDLYMPYANSHIIPKEGRSYLFVLTTSKNRRLAASMDIKDYLLDSSNYQVNDWVQGMVYSKNLDYGVFICVDEKYDGLIKTQDLVEDLNIGDELKARVISRNKDGKLNLSTRSQAHGLIDEDALTILKKLIGSSGRLPYGDKSDSSEIRKEFSMSKSSFKKALGKLYKKRLIEVTGRSISLVENVNIDKYTSEDGNV